MSTTITGHFKTHIQTMNAREDLIATGIPQEQIFVDEKHHDVKVTVPASSRPEIDEILMRHKATSTNFTTH